MARRRSSPRWGSLPTAEEDGSVSIWSVAGNGSRDEVSATFMQPFLTYTTPTFTTFGINTETTYDWEHRQGTVPIN